jgi:hypothetical protein
MEKDLLGTGYGAMTAIQNLGLAVFSLAIGHLQDGVGGTLKYTLPLLIFIGCGGIAVFLTFILIRRDTAAGVRLNASGAERAAKKQLLEDQNQANSSTLNTCAPTCDYNEGQPSYAVNNTQ